MNDFYNDTGWPAQGAPGDSSSARSEFALIQAAFDKMPLLTASRLVRVNAGATGLESVTAATADLATVTLIEGVTEKAVLVDADELQMLDSASTPVFGMVKATLLKLVVYLKAAGGTWVHNVTGNVSGSSGSCTGNAATATNVTTNANLTGGVTSVGNAATVVTNANLTGGVTSVGNAATVVTNANLTGDVTSAGNATTLASIPAISGANLTGTAANLKAGTVTSVTGATGNIAGSAGLNVLNDTGVGGVGTIAFATHNNSNTTASGATAAGTDLSIISGFFSDGSGFLKFLQAYTGTGTWRNISGSISQGLASYVLFQRIS